MNYIDAIPYGRPIAAGLVLGVVDFVFTSTCHEVTSSLGMVTEYSSDYKEEMDIADNTLLGRVMFCVAGPLMEELICRGALQSVCTKVIGFSLPFFKTTLCYGFPIANIASAIVVGTMFGMVHSMGYEKGGLIVGTVLSIGGASFGIAREGFGLVCPIVAHMVSNSMIQIFSTIFPDNKPEIAPASASADSSKSL